MHALKYDVLDYKFENEKSDYQRDWIDVYVLVCK